MFNKLINVAIVFSVVMPLLGCTVSAPFTAQGQLPAKAAITGIIDVPSGKSVIYIVRRSKFAGSAHTPFLKIDGKDLSALPIGSYAYAIVDPGRREILVMPDAWTPETLNIITKPNEKYFYEWDMRWGGGSIFKRLLPAEGYRLINRYSFVGSIDISTKEIDFASKGEETQQISNTTDVDSRPDPVSVSSLDFGNYHALLVGNNDYRFLPKLRTAINDARAMASLLQDKYRFKVQLLINAARADILRAINAYRLTLSNRDNLLIYYAGHGWLDRDADQGYWLPVDAEEQDPTNWISNGSITDALRAMQAKHVLVVADSCYSGKLSRGINVKLRTRNYYDRIVKKKARTVLASGGLEPVADDGGKGTHSVFASALIEALNENKNVIDATFLFSQIRRPVMLNSDQTPEYSDIRRAGHDGGDFLFVRLNNK